VDKPADIRTSRFSAGMTKAKEQQKRYQDKLASAGASLPVLAPRPLEHRCLFSHLACLNHRYLC